MAARWPMAMLDKSSLTICPEAWAMWMWPPLPTRPGRPNWVAIGIWSIQPGRSTPCCRSRWRGCRTSAIAWDVVLALHDIQLFPLVFSTRMPRGSLMTFLIQPIVWSEQKGIVLISCFLVKFGGVIGAVTMSMGILIGTVTLVLLRRPLKPVILTSVPHPTPPPPSPVQRSIKPSTTPPR